MNQLGSKLRDFLIPGSWVFCACHRPFWAKTYWAYQSKFNLGVTGSFQHLILAINPIPTTLFLLASHYTCQGVNRTLRC